MTIYTPHIEGRPNPKYRAIADTICEDIRRGALTPGTKLPTHRELAYRLGMTVGTVTRAYQELNRRGVAGGRVGNGTYVLDCVHNQAFFPLASPSPRPDGAPEIIHTPLPDHQIDLSMNRPTPGPEAMALSETLAELSRHDDLSILTQYNAAPGLPHHRRAMAELLREVGLECEGDDLILTSGAQHAMAAAALTLLQPGDTILCEELTYPGISTLGAHLGARMRPVAMDEYGIRPDSLETAAIETGARLIYLVPVFQNPTNALMNAERLRDIARIAKTHNLLLIEDDLYGFQPEHREPPLAQLIPEHTLYINSFSKSLSPGLRVGCVKVPKALFSNFVRAVQITGWMIPPLMGEIATRWITSGRARDIIAWHRSEMIARNAMAAEILGNFELHAKAESLHLWMELPDGHHASDVMRELRARNVLLSGPESFVTGQGAVPRALRLCLGSPPTRENLRTALERVRDVLQAKPVIEIARHQDMVM